MPNSHWALGLGTMGNRFSRPRSRPLSAACLVAIFISGSAVSAADQAAVAGTYCLQGVMEVGSCFRLSPDGKYEYFLSYGAYDETSEALFMTSGFVYGTAAEAEEPCL